MQAWNSCFSSSTSYHCNSSPSRSPLEESMCTRLAPMPIVTLPSPTPHTHTYTAQPPWTVRRAPGPIAPACAEAGDAAAVTNSGASTEINRSASVPGGRCQLVRRHGFLPPPMRNCQPRKKRIPPRPLCHGRQHTGSAWRLSARYMQVRYRPHRNLEANYSQPLQVHTSRPVPIQAGAHPTYDDWLKCNDRSYWAARRHVASPSVASVTRIPHACGPRSRRAAYLFGHIQQASCPQASTQLCVPSQQVYLQHPRG